MEKWVVPLSVALIAGLATIAAAYLAARKDRRDLRDGIARDLDLLEKLPGDSEARRMLAFYVEERVMLLSAEQQIRAAGRRDLWQMLTPVEALVAAWAWHRTGSWVAAAVVLLVVPVFVLWELRLRRESHDSAITARVEYIRDHIRPISYFDLKKSWRGGG
ncbi:hypothetical protein [Mycolicibacterium arenosum]|uniref:Uncharacterized protein n=1 Tax=Mycolicibacterium arenosum TaxID=2952157 RepID=A0ABT1LVE2_9MYCO|nr:hypothetical protein [Mycolicibacterium sp. CAU 1645]MCP9270560.1 hypothetical protein [Mycolicibacterium sp. CAU 1645]